MNHQLHVYINYKIYVNFENCKVCFPERFKICSLYIIMPIIKIHRHHFFLAIAMYFKILKVGFILS